MCVCNSLAPLLPPSTHYRLTVSSHAGLSAERSETSDSRRCVVELPCPLFTVQTRGGGGSEEGREGGGRDECCIHAYVRLSQRTDAQGGRVKVHHSQRER